MIYGILTLLVAFSSVAGWLYKVVMENKQLKENASLQKSMAEVEKLQDQVNNLNNSISEEERDYEKKKSSFNTNNGGSNPPPSNS